jgi:IS4 transposase
MVRVASLFSQVLSLFPRTEFHQAVRQHRAERYAKGFGCWEQFVAMLFCQLAQAKSLREISSGLACCLGELQHLGMTRAPSKSTLAYANEHRPWELYETLFGQLLSKCQALARGRKKFRFRNRLYSFDSTLVDLCVAMFDWARFRRTKGAIKLHLLLDHEGYLPSFAVVSEGRLSDVKMAWALDLPPDSVIVLDRGYVDYLLFGQWCREGVWFVTRMKEGAAYRVVERRAVPKHGGIKSDQVIELTGPGAWENCPYSLRRVRYRDSETGQTLVFLTNHLGFAASTIARIYKDRWQIELFFKALKQNLKIKTFVGTSSNAVRVQIWTALMAMLLLKYLQFRSRLQWALSNLVALVRWNLFTYRDLWAWLDNPFETPPLAPQPEQLLLRLA